LIRFEGPFFSLGFNAKLVLSDVWQACGIGRRMLDKPHASGSLALSRYVASAVLLALIVVCILAPPQRAETRRARAARSLTRPAPPACRADPAIAW
jgi:hypothetical protein